MGRSPQKLNNLGSDSSGESDEIAEIETSKAGRPARTAARVCKSTQLVPLPSDNEVSSEDDGNDQDYKVPCRRVARTDLVGRGSVDSYMTTDSTPPARQRYPGRLLQLELFNFKSYSGKHTIGPFSGFNAIVGPNGSGKSNIMDAISFVLGAQSRHIRSVRFEDLIFSKGDENAQFQNPTASVTLVFEDADKNQQKFCRKISGKGTASFYLNSNHISQSDYFTTLAQYNILVKARNFLVFQGDVEEIAQRPPQDLTVLLEEISGSGELKPEYEQLAGQVTRMRNETRMAFHHLRTVKAELRELENQVKETRNYKSILAEQERVKRNLFLIRLFCNETQAEDLHREREEITRQSLSDEAALETLRREIQQAHQRKLKCASKHATAQQELIEARESSSQADEELESAKRDVKSAQEAVRCTAQRQIRLQQDNLARRQHKLELEKNLDEATEELNKLNDAVRAAFDKSLKLTPSQQAEYDKLEASCKQRISANRRQLESLKAARDLATATVTGIQDKVEDTARRLRDTDHRLADIREQLALSEEILKKTLESKKCKVKEYEDLTNAVATATRDRTRLLEFQETKEAQLAECIATNHEIQSNARKRETLQKLKKNIGSGVKGFVAELCTPSSKRLNKAVYTAIAREADHVVVDTYDTGMKCIEFLKRENYDRMEFMPLDSRKGGGPAPNCLGGPDIQLAIRCVQFDPQYKNLFEEIFKDTVVVTSLEDGRKLAYDRGMKVRIVTEDGAKFNKNASLTINTDAETRATVFDTREHEALTIALEDISKQLRELTLVECKSGKQTLELECSVDKLTKNAGIQKERCETFSSEHDKLVTALDTLTETLACQSKELKHAVALKEAAQGRVDEASMGKELIEKDVFLPLSKRLGVADVHKTLQDLKDARRFQRENQANIRAKIERISADIIAIDQKEKETVELLREMDEQTKKHEDTIDKSEALLQSGAELLERSKDNEAQQERALQSLADEKREANVAVESKKAQMVTLEDAGNQRNLKEAKLIDSLAECTNGSRSVIKGALLESVELPLHRGTQDSLRRFAQGEARATDEVEISFDSLNDTLKQKLTRNPKEAAEQEVAAAAQAIAENQIELDRNTPNMSAESHCDAARLKCQTATEHCNEVRSTTQLTEQRFRQITKQRRERFVNCFNYVRAAVQRTYPILTGGDLGNDEHICGQAFLEIDDSQSIGADDRPFLCGIQYTVMPPSKRFREISLLSGGERAMAALALLFALQSYCPSPFFVLDEVDAALDPTNVRILGSFLEKIDLQLIVISLKDRLYRKASSLFGIYKNLQKVESHVLSLNLEAYPREGDDATAYHKSDKRLSSRDSFAASSHSVLQV